MSSFPINSIQLDTIKSGMPFIDKSTIRNYLNKLEYPIYCLDFETLSLAIPPFNNIRPYQNIPFQFSIHKIHHLKSNVEHFSFLSDGQNNFIYKLIDALKVIGPKGTVLAYYMSFEKKVLETLGELSPANINWLNEIMDRMVDLIEPFKTFLYYHPDQHGSCSLKSVLPVLTNKGYQNLNITNGIMASLTFYLTHMCKSTENERANIRRDLLEYCNQDTGGMVEILRMIDDLSKE